MTEDKNTLDDLAESEGELIMRIGIREDQVVLDFGESLRWVALPRHEALALAEALVKTAKVTIGPN